VSSRTRPRLNIDWFTVHSVDDYRVSDECGCVVRCGWEHALSGQQNSNRFRAYRKNIGRILGSQTAAAKFNTLQDVEIRRFLLRLLEKPDKLVQHIRTLVCSVPYM
jgi:hypothetical protein